ncbi:FlgD immunoglobulin-like domain containing protein [Xanthovirga aplysinae]|uniref:FlgD immunoglobulin-like domain containing protein n=1 Tax=Xanthovirga aplysinae TaxID=2529853 RepID=UPI0012BCE87C|nr:FlgD immunoglobulin-like domain containing protein [Xanthovirga aplysinae]MTI33559.1 T9SS type A sorting domain-containing protein [Xanthovirga aplysinae]
MALHFYKKTLFFILLLSMIGIGYFIYLPSPTPTPKPDFSFIQAKSAVGSQEDPRARLNYETNMLVNPANRIIPEKIRQKELIFAKTIESRQTHIQRSDASKAELFEGTEWEAKGPYNVGGRTRALAIDRSNENRILAGGVSGGIWISENSGDNWSKVTKNSDLHSVTCIIQSTRDEKTWYYGTGELRGNTASGGGAAYRGDGIFKSTDNGESWELLPSTSDLLDSLHIFNKQFNYIWNLAINPNTEVQDEVYAATYGGILRSTNGEDNWELVLGDGHKEASAFYTDLAINSNGTMYAALSSETLDGVATQTGIYTSTDGLDWKPITPFNWPRNFRRTVIGIAPSNPDLVYFLTDTEERPRLWKYNAGTKKWTDLSVNIPSFGGDVGDLDLQESYNMLLKVHPKDENIVFLGGTNLYRSTDGFQSSKNTEWIGGYSTENDISNYKNHHPDQHAIFFYPSNPDEMLSGHDGGISKTSNNKAGEVNWQNLNNGYVTAQFYTIAIDKASDSDLIIGGLQDNGSYAGIIENMSEQWTQLLSGDGGYSAVTANGGFIYASFQEGQTYRLSVNNDLELTGFTRVDPKGAGNKTAQEYLFINPFVIDPNNNNKMYLAGGDKIWINNNLSQIRDYSQNPTLTNWESVYSSRVEPPTEEEIIRKIKHQISALAVSRNPANILYYGTNKGELYKIEEATGGDAQTDELTHNLQKGAETCNGACLDGGYISSISVDPRDANKVLVAFSNYEIPSIFYSEDGGVTFTDVSGTLEQNPDGSGNGPSVRWAEILPMTNNSSLFLAGSSTGLYSSYNLDGLNTEWSQEGEDVIGNVVVPMITYRTTDGKVAIATHGNGVYTKEFDNIEHLKVSDENIPITLSQNYPNPLSDITYIKFELPKSGETKIRIFNAIGQEVRTLLHATQFHGENQVSWDGTDSNGGLAPDGLYFYRLEFGETAITKRMILNRGSN